MLARELEAVRAFQKLFDVTLAKVGTPINQTPEPHQRLNRRIIDEEIGETITKGVQAGNEIEIADGCADALYVIAHAINQLGRIPNCQRDAAAAVALAEARDRINSAFSRIGLPLATDDDIDRNLSYAEIIVRGVAAVYNIPLDAVFDEVHRSNMTKVWPDGKGRKDEGGKVLKPDTYERARIAEVLSGARTG